MIKDDYDRLRDIRQEMIDLLDEAKNIIRMEDKHIYERAKAYWIGHIDRALGGGDYFDKYDCTMLKSINELGCEDEDMEDEEEENGT